MIRFGDAEKIELIHEEIHTGTYDYEKHKVVWSERFFEEANAIFTQKKTKIISVYNQNGELDCVCFNQMDQLYDKELGFLKLLDSFEETVNFLEYMDAKAEALCIHGLNELSYELYRVAKNIKSML